MFGLNIENITGKASKFPKWPPCTAVDRWSCHQDCRRCNCCAFKLLFLLTLSCYQIKSRWQLQ